MAYTTLVAGTTITASWANANVRDQTVSPFADSTARDAAITAPVDGMLAYLTGTNSLSSYDGSAWCSTGPMSGAMLTYTPTLTQSGAVTKTVTASGYVRLGRMVWGYVDLACTGSGTGANPVVIGLPITAALSTGVIGGIGYINDASASTVYVGAPTLSSTTTFSMYGTGGVSGVLGAAQFTAALVSTDVVRASFMYQAASDA